MGMKENQTLPTKIYVKAKKDGILSLMTAAPRYVYSNHLRSHLLTHKQTVSYSGIETPYNASIFDRFVPGYSQPENNPTYESAEVDAVREYTRDGDDVVIVGAGRGITPTVAANSVGKNGQVIAYEASTDRVSRANKTVQYNQVRDLVEIHHRIVAKAADVRGTIGSASIISPSELPSCDFLELDCEGAEELILEEMNITPRVISVETHETKGVSHSNVLELLESRGYQVTEETDKTDQHEGIRHIVAILRE